MFIAYQIVRKNSDYIHIKIVKQLSTSLPPFVFKWPYNPDYDIGADRTQVRCDMVPEASISLQTLYLRGFNEAKHENILPIYSALLPKINMIVKIMNYVWENSDKTESGFISAMDNYTSKLTRCTSTNSYADLMTTVRRTTMRNYI